MKDKITFYINQGRGNLENLHQKEDVLRDIASVISRCKKRKGTVFLCGNGGSSSTASHISQDFQKMCGLKSICLNDSVPLLTAWANDTDYKYIFSKQLEALAKKGDVLIVFTGSGNSENIIEAVEWALSNDVYIVALLGLTGGYIKEFLRDKDKCSVIHIQTDMQHIEDLHLVIGHLLLKLIEDSV